LARPRILVVGSSNTDLVVRADRIPAPGETILGGDLAIHPGGKGANQAVAAAKLGGEVALIARIGNDDFGDRSYRSYESHGVMPSYLIRDEIAPSGVALIAVDQAGHNSILVAPGANRRLSSADIEGRSEAFDWAEMVLLQLEIPIETVAAAVRLAAKHGKPVLLNPAPAAALPFEILRDVAYLVPNEREAQLLTGSFDAPPEALAEQLLAMGPRNAIVTLGEHGAVAATPDGTLRQAAYRVETVDTTAAGDCFCGALAVSLTEGAGLNQALRFACASAATCVTRPGAQSSMPSRPEVNQFLNASAA
jgi:ribokinase